jgi:hypothetical protein
MDERSDRGSELAERLFRDAAGALELYTVYLGERLGLYRALNEGGPATLHRAGRAHRHHRALRPRVAGASRQQRDP